MVKRVIWSPQAIKDRKKILRFWTRKNGSDLFSKKLARLFNQAVETIQKEEYGGRITDYEGIRVHPCERYLIYYEEEAEYIIIHTIWDPKRNPKDNPLQ